LDGSSLERAVQLIQYFQSHARKAYAVMDLDPVIAKARRVYDWLRSHEACVRFNRRVIQQHLRRHHWSQKPSDLDEPLQLLEQHGFVRLAPGSSPSRREFEFNPLAPHPQYPQYPQPASVEESTEDVEDMPNSS
jgi:hypothetical protein